MESLFLAEDIALRRARLKRCLSTIIRLPEYLRGVRGKDNLRVPTARFERCARDLSTRLAHLQNQPTSVFDAQMRQMARYVTEYYQWASSYLRARKVRLGDLQVWRQFEGDAGAVLGMVGENMADRRAGFPNSKPVPPEFLEFADRNNLAFNGATQPTTMRNGKVLAGQICFTLMDPGMETTVTCFTTDAPEKMQERVDAARARFS